MRLTIKQEKFCHTPEWHDIIPLTDSFETRISRLADTNDYFAEPILKMYNKINKMSNKDKVGKVVEFEMKTDMDGKISHGDAEYATRHQAPDAIKLELDTTHEGIRRLGVRLLSRSH